MDHHARLGRHVPPRAAKQRERAHRCADALRRKRCAWLAVTGQEAGLADRGRHAEAAEGTADLEPRADGSAVGVEHDRQALEVLALREGFEIGFNARYLLDVCGQITGEIAEFRFADPASPTLVLDPNDPGVQYVLMPLRV